VTVARDFRPWASAVGVATALSLPLWLGSRRLTELIRSSGSLKSGPEAGEPAAALRAALRTLRILARTRLPWWRNTCLFRALAECLVLRHYGIACHVELGVTHSGDAVAIAAHAWVVRGAGNREPYARSLAILR
jgi:hypothetical protein